MNRPVVLFCTAAGGEYGFGHLKRCIGLIDEAGPLFDARILLDSNPGAADVRSTDLFGKYEFVENLGDAGTIDLIVSDQRDTNTHRMFSYTRRAPVVALDDCGAGRKSAHVSIFSIPTTEGYTGNFNGPDYLILDRSLRENRVESGPYGRVVVSFGGSDTNNLSQLITEALNDIGIEPLVVRGPFFQHKPPAGNCETVERPASLHETLCTARVLITSFGMTMYEAMFLGVPVLLFNHSTYHAGLSLNIRGVTNLGCHGQTGFEELREALRRALANPEELHERARSGKSVVDGRGTERVLSVMERALQARRRDCLFMHGSPKALTRDSHSSLMRCRRCGDLFLFDMNSRKDRYGDENYFISSYKEKYGKTYIEDRENIVRLGKDRMDMIERFLPGDVSERDAARNGTNPEASIKLLDVGCALGFFLDIARERGWKTTGVEVSVFAANWARENLNLDVVNRSFIEAEFDPEYFDVITFFFVAEHLRDVEKVIEKAYCLLKRGGVIGLSLPNRGGITYRADRERYVRDHPRDHFWDTNPRNLTGFLKGFGFRKSRLRTTGIHPERFFERIGLHREVRILYSVYRAAARVLRLGDTFEYFGIKT